jgi:hypothetical protein
MIMGSRSIVENLPIQPGKSLWQQEKLGKTTSGRQSVALSQKLTELKIKNLIS